MVAEAAKVIENAQRDINIAFRNDLARTFDRMGIRTKDALEAARTKGNFLPFSAAAGRRPHHRSRLLLPPHKAERLSYQSQVILLGPVWRRSERSFALCHLIEVVTTGQLNQAMVRAP